MQLQRPSHNCAITGCKEPTIKRYCAEHTQQTNRAGMQKLHASQTSQERTRKYGPGWKEQRARIIQRDQGCAYCRIQTDTHPLEVHHLTNNDRPADRELVTLCRRHHRAIEAENKRGTTGKVGTVINQWMQGQ